MNIVAVAGATVPSDTANSLQTMKACQALVQLGHQVTLLVPGSSNTSVDLQAHYGLQTGFPIEWLSSSSRRMFTWEAVRRACALNADLLYSWFPQSAVFGLLSRLPVVFEIHIQPTGFFGPLWHRLFANLRGRKRLASITRALMEILERDFRMHFPAEEVVIAPNGVDLEEPRTPEPLPAGHVAGQRAPNAPTGREDVPSPRPALPGTCVAPTHRGNRCPRGRRIEASGAVYKQAYTGESRCLERLFPRRYC